jgi:Carboxypeptidase regulatory-like domain/TonB dependent receptor-like, beta-barrel
MRIRTSCNILLQLCLCALCSMLLIPGAAGQASNAAITGTVGDSTGAAVSGATVTATNDETGITKSVVAGADGQYTLVDLAPGYYDVTVSQAGFAQQVVRHQELLIGTTNTLNFTLKVASTTQTVEVQAEGATVEPTQSTVSRILLPTELNTLPVLNRNFASLAVLTPGVQSSGVSYGGSSSVTSASVQIGNAAAYSTAYVMDGLSDETNNQGGPYTQIAQDWTQEFSVLDLQFPAEYGAASGGVINVLTRSGGNQLHGRAYGFFQNDALNSNPEFYKLPTKAPFSSERIGGMLGGPIIKDKLFYFAGFEYFHQSATVTIGHATTGAFAATAQPIGTPASQLVPWLVYGTASTGPQTVDSRLAMLKLDYTPNSTNSFMFRGNLDYEYAGNSGLGGSGTFGAAYNSFAPNFAEVASWTRTLSPNAINELYFGYFSRWTTDIPNFWTARGLYTGGALNPDPYNYVTTASLGGPTFLGNPTGIWAGVSYSGVTVGAASCPCGLLNGDESGLISDSFTITRANHVIKIGGSIRRIMGISTQGHELIDGRYSFAGSAGPFNPNTAIPQNFTAAGFSTAEALAPLSDLVGYGPPNLMNFSFPSYAFGVFAQDSWRVAPNLTLNIGLRYDFSNTNSSLSKAPYPGLAAVLPGSRGFIQPGFHNINNDPYNIAPRFGFAWTPFNDSQHTVLRGGFGLFYDQNNTAAEEVYIAANSEITESASLAANVATKNPYCIGNTSCSAGIPAVDEFAVSEVLASALANYTLPVFPTSTSPCKATSSCTVAVGSNVYNIPALTIPYNPGGGVSDIEPNLAVPGVMQVTGGVEHQFSNAFTVSADFVYRRGFDELVSVNNNVALSGPGATTNYIVVNPAFTQIQTFETNAYSVSKDLDVQAHYRDLRGDSLQLAYQFGYADDDDYTNFVYSGLNALTTDPFDTNLDYGPSSTDARNMLTVSGVANMGWGFELAPIVTYTGALPYTATSVLQAPGTALAPPGCLAYFTRCYPSGYSRNSVRGGNFFSLSARLQKTIKLGESRGITLMLEGYNITNRHNLGTNFFNSVDPSSGFPNGNIGTPNGTQLPLRQLQVGARFDF